MDEKAEEKLGKNPERNPRNLSTKTRHKTVVSSFRHPKKTEQTERVFGPEGICRELRGFQQARFL